MSSSDPSQTTPPPEKPKYNPYRAYPPLEQVPSPKASATDLPPDYDCMPCRVMGAAAFVGLGAYTYYEGQRQITENERRIAKSASRFGVHARRSGITGISAMLVGMGLYRWVM
ncbi:hypothetical protein EJ05DRAFT_510419 [Pseudovirgaria hyperparasitica]|uniref:Distal membrane-arm assembly complex protein 1-like domain-containing protein n=1 Tax=Pseudovirgaria hyperparasitica TaxID=470096 RepID=A0A6A6W8G2_9PEZI|nr:uncharacterized protein EJ05DRAFT_510419 [Pseudovirgaria hyperparasitica]KAF2758499.1 hypothetical protein EJ05DRAFT_510419 [Pseudovirgaria hyperparasitica]